MKIQICRNAKCIERGDVPIMMLREFNGSQCNLVSKTRESDGSIMIGIKDTYLGNPVKQWPLLKQINEDIPNEQYPNEREEVIRYVIDDQYDPSKNNDDWEKHPSANMHDADSQGSELIDSD